MPICARMVKDLATVVATGSKTRSDVVNEVGRLCVSLWYTFVSWPLTQGLMVLCHEKFQRLCVSDALNVELALCACE